MKDKALSQEELNSLFNRRPGRKPGSKNKAKGEELRKKQMDGITYTGRGAKPKQWDDPIVERQRAYIQHKRTEIKHINQELLEQREMLTAMNVGIESLLDVRAAIHEVDRRLFEAKAYLKTINESVLLWEQRFNSLSETLRTIHTQLQTLHGYDQRLAEQWEKDHVRSITWHTETRNNQEETLRAVQGLHLRLITIVCLGASLFVLTKIILPLFR